jgi:hypothetical protein
VQHLKTKYFTFVQTLNASRKTRAFCKIAPCVAASD